MNISFNTAIRRVILFGIVSLLADLTYESARSIIGPYMALLGASAVVVGMVSGTGELLSYSIRMIAGRIADRTQQYWMFVWVGYVINLLAIPLLAAVGRWELAALLVLLERLGKALRSPARDALLAQATVQIGHGKGFGIHELLDQVGAVAGPLMVALSLAIGLGYRTTLSMLFIPALAALCALWFLQRSWDRTPTPTRNRKAVTPSKLSRQYWLAVAAAGCAAAGFTDFPLLAYHLHATGATTDAGFPILYAIAMALDGSAAVGLGYVFDRYGISVAAAATLLSAAATPLIVHGGWLPIAVGFFAWSVGMGAHESVVRASIATIIPTHLLGTAFGTLSGWYGLAWMAGSSVQGILYTISPYAMAAASAILQLLAAILWFAAARKR